MPTRSIDDPRTSPDEEQGRSDSGRDHSEQDRNLGEGLSSCQRLRRSADYVRCYRRGRKKHGALVVLHVHPNDLGEARLGITASRKVGKAVVRHRIKRRAREIFRRFERRAELASLDIVVHVKPPAGSSDFRALEGELHRLFGKVAKEPGKHRPMIGGQR